MMTINHTCRSDYMLNPLLMTQSRKRFNSEVEVAFKKKINFLTHLFVFSFIPFIHLFIHRLIKIYLFSFIMW